MDYDFTEKTLITQSFEVNFDDNIVRVILFDNVFVVLLSSADRNGKIIGETENNIYGVDICGKIIWKIQDPRIIYPSRNNEALFTGINKTLDNRFIATTFSAFKYDFDYKTGAIRSYNGAGRW